MGIDGLLLPKAVRDSSGQFGKHRRIWSCRNRAVAIKWMKRHILRLDLCSKPILFSGVRKIAFCHILHIVH